MMIGAVALAACRPGGGAGSTGSNSTPASNRPFAAYRRCLGQHGVTPPGPGVTRGTGEPADATAFAAARRACRALRPAGGLRGGGLNGTIRAAFRRCMVDHGVTLGAPGSAGTLPGAATAPVPRGGMLAGLDRHDPTVAKALVSCRPLLVPPSSTTTRR